MYERQPEMTQPQDLVPLNSLEDWDVEEGEPDIRGWDLVDQDGNSIGKIDDLMVSMEEEEAVMAVVSYGGIAGIGGGTTLVPVGFLRLDMDNERVVYIGSPDDIRNAPRYSKDTREFRQFYDYWSGKQMFVEGQEPVSGRKGGERPEEVAGRERASCEGVKLFEEQSIEDISCGEIKKKQD